MKPFLILVALVCIIWSPARGSEERAPKQKPQVHNLSVAAFSDTFAKPEWFFLLDGVVAYRTLDALKEAIGKTVSPGATLQWESNDIGITPEPFSSLEKLKEFGEYCAARGVRLAVLPGG